MPAHDDAVNTVAAAGFGGLLLTGSGSIPPQLGKLSNLKNLLMCNVRTPLLEVEDEADEWGPPGSDRSCGTWLSERGREEPGRGSKDISRVYADWAPTCRAGVACHMRKCGKLRTQTSLIWQSCK